METSRITPSHYVTLEHKFSWEVHLKWSLSVLEDRGCSGSHEQRAASPFAINPFDLTQKVSSISLRGASNQWLGLGREWNWSRAYEKIMKNESNKS